MSPGSKKEIEDATKDDPDGAICGFCLLENDLADDCGWWFIDPFGTKDSKQCCTSCWNRGLGKMHQEYYGVGER